MIVKLKVWIVSINNTPKKHMQNNKKILVVEDDRAINELISYNLVKSGFKVTSVYDGIDAKETLRSERFEIVVLDIMLPGSNGFDICKDIRNAPESFNTYVIVVSAKVGAQDKLYAHILGADCYITKPFGISAFVEIVKEINSFKDKEYTVKS